MPLSENGNLKLRLIDAQPVSYEGATYLLLRDPLALTDKTLLVPQPYVPILSLLDGSRNIGALRAAAALRFGLFLTPERIAEFIHALDDALLLENVRSEQARQIAREQFRREPFRPPASAGLSYPQEAAELSAYLQQFIDEAASTPTPDLDGSMVRGVVSPHIDYERGGPVYAQVWSAAAQAAREADLAIIFGTDHFSEGYPFSLTCQNYATPYGVLPTAQQIVDELAAVIGPENAFAGELHHRREHSIELAAVWLHHMRGGRPVELVPVLCGSMESALGAIRPESGTQAAPPDIEAILAVLRRAAQSRKTLVVAAGDLAHVGPAFSGDPVDPGKLILLQQADEELIQAMCNGDAEGFYQAIQRAQDVNNVCGVSPIYLTLRLLQPIRGQRFGYSVCPADQHQTSVVTICGVVLHQ